LGRSLKEKKCIVTGWDWKLDRIDKNADFYKPLEERDVEKSDLGKKNTMPLFFSMCLCTCTMLTRYCNKAGIF
jgi:hypothetical protein